MSRHQISCINKRGNHFDPHERISHVGGGSDGKRWKLAEDDAIKGIESKTYEFYVSVGEHTANVVVAIHNGRKYLKTQSDGYRPDNLLSLPECP